MSGPGRSVSGSFDDLSTARAMLFRKIIHALRKASVNV
jgi:hypothetical protein